MRLKYQKIKVERNKENSKKKSITPFTVYYQQIYYHYRQHQTHKRKNALVLMNRLSSMLLSSPIKIFLRTR